MTRKDELKEILKIALITAAGEYAVCKGDKSHITRKLTNQATSQILSLFKVRLPEKKKEDFSLGRRDLIHNACVDETRSLNEANL